MSLWAYVPSFTVFVAIIYLDQDSYHKGTDGLFYKFHSQNVNWFRAKSICQAEGAHLAFVRSNATFQYIRDSYTQHMQGIWLGGRDRNSNNSWTWRHSEPIQKSYWVSGEPNNWNGTQEDCMITNCYNITGEWLDVSCEWDEPNFLCQKGNVHLRYICIIYVFVLVNV